MDKKWFSPFTLHKENPGLKIQNNEDYTKPNNYGEIHLGNQDSVGYNSDAELYDREIEKYETQARGF